MINKDYKAAIFKYLKKIWAKPNILVQFNQIVLYRYFTDTPFSKKR